MGSDLLNRAITRLKRTEHPVARAGLLRMRSAPNWLARGPMRRSAIVERYLSESSAPRLHVGAGPVQLDGWLDSDLIAGDIYLDLTRPFPLPAGRFRFVFGEHVIEHLTETQGLQMLQECFRVLEPGGVVRITTPDLRKLISIYEGRNPVISTEDYARFLDEETGKRHERPAQIFNDYLRLWGHRHIYDEDDLRARLEEVGFVDVTRRDPGQSPHPELCGIERHGGAAWVNEAEAMCLEATRPGASPAPGDGR